MREKDNKKDKLTKEQENEKKKPNPHVLGLEDAQHQPSPMS
jgi:hypothetical protein